MDFLALAAALAQPPDHAVARSLPVGHDAKQLVNPLLTKHLRGKRQLRLVAQRQLAQRFTHRQKAIIGLLAAVSGPVRDIANLSPFLVALLRLVVHPADQRFHASSGVASTAARKASVTSA